ncbi:2-(1,2-epoxy-1,2-dihydrophenyl)acetyl-CoA isomerase [Sphingomonas vulcanisoli]|uniref:2-(1,2-epoxy-1,2-dihydrophenyl)acetyl-CoA isomerase n=1 Tax=Sphingomonas vulcanisoli TaxID=1658060 RepID=A0ABX0TUS3_9SPHN|nr:2-(1,2-epoxy-1,2-dihydrophenyl)acetyl-CoA isomerase [Sphingomonas vulcanisoli]
MVGKVELAIAEGVATIRLNRPDRLNAFDAELHADLREALSAVEADSSVRALVLTGAGRAFCAGQDLGERDAAFARGETPDLGASLSENYNPLIRRLVALPYPVIAAVNGIASGAGAALAIACDIVVAAQSARFQFGFVRVALGPDAGTSWLLPRRVGRGRALALALTGEAIDADRALAIGLCDRIVNDDNLGSAATELATGFAKGPQQAIHAIKQALRTAPPSDLAAALTTEQISQAALGAATDYREAVTAFTAKRTPKFSERS